MSIMIGQGEHLCFSQRDTIETGQTKTGQDTNETSVTDRSQTKRIEIFEEFFHLNEHIEWSKKRRERYYSNPMNENMMTNASH